jgi:glycosyltransferase involved in cell wall biosynthesis
MTTIKFSVIIPLYQKQNTIRRAIDSVLAQTYSDFELIVVDDGSTDNGSLLVKQQTDERVRLIQQTNQGVSVARNTGINSARYEYLAFLDADDEWLPLFLAEMCRLIHQYPSCGWYSCGISYHTQRVLPKQNLLAEGCYSNYFEVASQCNVVTSSSVVIPVEVAKEVGGFPVGVIAGQDLLMWVKIASKYPFAYTPINCSIYHFVEGNIYKRIRPDEPDIFSAYLDTDNEVKNEYLAMQAIHRGILHSIYGNKKLARAIERNYAFTKQHKKEYNRLKKLNKVPSIILHLYYKCLGILVNLKRKIVYKK